MPLVVALVALVALIMPTLASGTAGLAQATPVACIEAGAASPASADSFITVPNGSSDGYLDMFDSTSSSLLGSPVTVGVDPFAAAVDPTNSQVYVADKGDSTVDVVDYLTGALTTSIALPSGADPEAIAVDPGAA